MGLIAKSEWTRRNGFSRAYVSKLVKQGKIPLRGNLVDEDKAISRKELQNQFLEAKLKNEQTKGEILEAKTAAIERQYVSAEAVRKVAKARERIIRETLLQIPDRVSTLIAPLKDAAQIHEILTNEMRNALFELSNNTQI
ncbi:MAG: hypothetical protein LBL99_00445 [Holosporaceae bacterium]|jgi:small-conductance mechanosensitive channel|nr:hypothetical protein [Holosporaceae bacterium]